MSDDSEFDMFWACYPRTRGTSKVTARRAWVKARKKTSKETILAGVAWYVTWIKRKGTAEEFTLHPSTFLNQERYMDYAEPSQKGKEMALDWAEQTLLREAK